MSGISPSAMILPLNNRMEDIHPGDRIGDERRYGDLPDFLSRQCNKVPVHNPSSNLYDPENPSPCPRDSPFHKEKIFVGDNFHDLEVLYGAFLVPVMPWKTLPLKNPPWSGIRTTRSRSPMKLGAVGILSSPEPMAFDHPLVTSPLCSSLNRNGISGLKQGNRKGSNPFRDLLSFPKGKLP
jgi:hypothetical protein